MDAKALSQHVRSLSMSSQQTRRALGGPLFTSEIERSLLTAQAYHDGRLPSRSRVLLGWCAMQEDRVLGYASATLLRGASPTAYEREYLGLHAPLSYVHGKILVVDPLARKQGIGGSLLSHGIDLARQAHLSYVADVRRENDAVSSLLRKHGLTPTLSWRTPRGTLMMRYSS